MLMLLIDWKRYVFIDTSLHDINIQTMPKLFKVIKVDNITNYIILKKMDTRINSI